MLGKSLQMKSAGKKGRTGGGQCNAAFSDHNVMWEQIISIVPKRLDSNLMKCSENAIYCSKCKSLWDSTLSKDVPRTSVTSQNVLANRNRISPVKKTIT